MYFFSAARPQIQADPGVFLCTAQADPGRDERTPSAHVSCGYLQRLKSREVLEHVLRQGRELAGRDVTFCFEGVVERAQRAAEKIPDVS